MYEILAVTTSHCLLDNARIRSVEIASTRISLVLPIMLLLSLLLLVLHGLLLLLHRWLMPSTLVLIWIHICEKTVFRGYGWVIWFESAGLLCLMWHSTRLECSSGRSTCAVYASWRPYDAMLWKETTWLIRLWLFLRRCYLPKPVLCEDLVHTQVCDLISR